MARCAKARRAGLPVSSLHPEPSLLRHFRTASEGTHGVRPKRLSWPFCAIKAQLARSFVGCWSASSRPALHQDPKLPAVRQ